MNKYFIYILTAILLVGFIPRSCSNNPEPSPDPIPVETLEAGLWVGEVDSEAGFTIDLEFTVNEIDGAEISGTANFVDEPVATEGTMTGVYKDPNWVITL